jgi:hypothetical protein
MTEQIDESGEGIVERGMAVVGTARDKADDLLESARGEAGNLQATLADRLEAGAEKIRTQAARSGASVGTAPPRSVLATARARTTDASLAATDRMDRTAVWLRENDVTDVGRLLRRELRERPGRVALVALGLGILIGRASRRGRGR